MLERLFPKQAPPRLTPEQLQTILLDEIAGRLGDMQSQGILDSRTVVVGQNWTPLHESAWLSCHVFNDGDPNNPDADGNNGQVSLYLTIGDTSTRPWEEGKAPLKRNETLELDLRVRRHWPSEAEIAERDGLPRVVPPNAGSPPIYGRCQSGTASVRIFVKV